MSQSCPNNGRFPINPEPYIIFLALIYTVTHLEVNQIQALIAIGELAGFAHLMHGLLRSRS